MDFDPQDVERFVASESVTLRQHLAETIVRLYVAHIDARSCPWLQVAMLRSPREFNQMVGQLAEGGDRVPRNAVTRVFFGPDEPPPDSGIGVGVWQRSVDVHRELLVTEMLRSRGIDVERSSFRLGRVVRVASPRQGEGSQVRRRRFRR